MNEKPISPTGAVVDAQSFEREALGAIEAAETLDDGPRG